MVRQVPAMLNVTDLKQSLEQFVNIVEVKEQDCLTALIEVIVNNDFSDDPAEWNMLLRDLEGCGLEQSQNYYHQISDEDFSIWFKK